MISYTVLQDDDANVNVKIHVGKAIDVQEDNKTAYAIIQAIFTHIANDNKKYAFLILDWYYDTGQVDNFTGSKIYDLQEFNNDIHSFNIIVKNPHIHLCTTVGQPVLMDIQRIIRNTYIMSFSI